MVHVQIDSKVGESDNTFSSIKGFHRPDRTLWEDNVSSSEVFMTYKKSEERLVLGAVVADSKKRLAYLSEARRLINALVEKPKELPPGVCTWLETYPDRWIEEAEELGEEGINALFGWVEEV